MFRFLTIVWDPQNTAQSSAVTMLTEALSSAEYPLPLVFRSTGILLYAAPKETPSFEVRLLEDGCGAILGAIYERNRDTFIDTPNAVPKLDLTESKRMVSSEARNLVEDYWGDYVAVILDRARNIVRILKDPTGSLPCYIVEWRDVTIAFSCFEDCAALNLVSFSVNWAYVAAVIDSGGYDQSEAPLNEVAELHGGECIELSVCGKPVRSRRIYWSPTKFPNSDVLLTDVENAQRAFHATIRGATRTLAKEHNRVLMRLSGGLDSSIVSSALASAPSQVHVTSYAFFSPGGRCDARRWAQLVAEKIGWRHQEFEIDPMSVDLTRLMNTRPTVAPMCAYSFLPVSDIEESIARAFPYSAIFTGDGGDNVLGGHCVPFAVDDYLRVNGLSIGALSLAANVARRTNSLAWTVLARALRRHYFPSRTRKREKEISIAAQFATGRAKHLRSERSSHAHPWLEGGGSQSWISILKIGNLLSPSIFYNPLLPRNSTAPYLTMPLYSQPVLEASLKIPAHILFLRGVERGLAREAFRDDLPEPIVRRQWKDRAPGAFETIVQRNRQFVHDVLINGQLCKEGLLDRDALHQALNSSSSRKDFYMGEILAHLELELWIRHFTMTKKERMAA